MAFPCAHWRRQAAFPMHTALRKARHARQAAWRCCSTRRGRPRVVVNTHCGPANDPAFFAAHGIDLAATRLLCVKAKNHFRAAFAERCAAIIDVDCPGPAMADVARLRTRFPPPPPARYQARGSLAAHRTIEHVNRDGALLFLRQARFQHCLEFVGRLRSATRGR